MICGSHACSLLGSQRINDARISARWPIVNRTGRCSGSGYSPARLRDERRAGVTLVNVASWVDGRGPPVLRTHLGRRRGILFARGMTFRPHHHNTCQTMQVSFCPDNWVNILVCNHVVGERNCQAQQYQEAVSTALQISPLRTLLQVPGAMLQASLCALSLSYVTSIGSFLLLSTGLINACLRWGLR